MSQDKIKRVSETDTMRLDLATTRLRESSVVLTNLRLSIDAETRIGQERQRALQVLQDEIRDRYNMSEKASINTNEGPDYGVITDPTPPPPKAEPAKTEEPAKAEEPSDDESSAAKN